MAREHRCSAAVAVNLAAFVVATGCAPAGSEQSSNAASKPPAAVAIESLVPSGWTVEQRHEADFNADTRRDVLLIVRRVADTKAPSERLLLVALGAAEQGRYTLHSRNDQLIPSDASGRIVDPLEDGGVEVRPGGFELTLGMMPAVGSYQTATIRYRFDFEGDCFRLTGYDRAETHRGTLDTRDVRIDFVTGSVVHIVGNAQSTGGDERREQLASNPRRCLPDLPNGWTFNPL